MATTKRIRATHPKLSTLPLAMFMLCTGEAHSNPWIDNCSCCAPRWGVVVCCKTCKVYGDGEPDDRPMPLDEYEPPRGGRYPVGGPLWGRCPKCGTDYRTGTAIKAEDLGAA